ncbi:hypothetical protein LPJ54_005899, partial [Coemansia sp. RSA 1824]
QARNPQADQEALEQEIRQVERLASLLGRRQTRFDRKRGAPKVNHDLDATLTGFFDVEDNDHVGEILLSAGHRHDEADDVDDVDDAVIDNPRLTAKNIHAAPVALLAQEQQSGDYQHSDDPFDKIEEMNMAESPSGSAEYLPLDTYKSEEVIVAAASSNSLQGSLASSNSAEARVSSGKLAADVADADDEDDDDMLLGVIRSATWKRHSSALIKEREQHGPAMPAIIDEDEEEAEDCAVTEPKYISEVAAAETTAAPTSTATAENKVLMAQKNAALTRKLSLMRARVMANAQDSLAQAGLRSGLRTDDAGPEPEQAVEIGVPSVLSPLSPPGASMVDDYMDILDFMDSAQPADMSDRDDGHISSDLLGNSYSSSSSSSSIDLSAADSSDSADSDSHYLAQLIQPRRLSVVNVVNEPRVLPAVEPPATKPPVAAPSADTVDTQTPALEAASVATAGMLNNRSTLRRNRRITSRGRGLRGGHTSMLGPRSTTEPSAESSARSSDVDSGERSRTVGSGERSRTIESHAASEHLASTLRASLSLGSPEKVVEDSRPRTVGLAQLARDAISMNEQHTNTRMRHIQPLLSSTKSQKPLPPIPDRLLRTLE